MADEQDLKAQFAEFLKEQGIEPPPPKEPTTYAEFFERFTKDFTAFLSSQKEGDEGGGTEGDEGGGKGKRKPDEEPSSVHPMFKRLGASG